MRVLLTGASGQLGAYLLQHVAQQQRFDVIAWSGSKQSTVQSVVTEPVDLTDSALVLRRLRYVKPDVILHVAALSTVGGCVSNPELAHSVNVLGTQMLANWAAENNARIVFTSTDLVFDGTQGNYREEDQSKPLSCYGATKLEAEAHALRCSNGMVIRLSLMYGESLTSFANFYDQQCEALKSSKPVKLFDDEWRTPLHLADAASGILLAADSEATGVFHLGGPERMSRWEMGCVMANKLNVENSFEATKQSEMKFPEPRPADVSLCSEKWVRHFPTHERTTFDRHDAG